MSATWSCLTKGVCCGWQERTDCFHQTSLEQSHPLVLCLSLVDYDHDKKIVRESDLLSNLE